MTLLFIFIKVPGEPPVILEAISNTSTSIELRWTEVTELYSMPLLGYVIVYKKRNENFRVESMKSVLPMPLEAVVEDLEKFTHYIIRIYAFNLLQITRYLNVCLISSFLSSHRIVV